MHNWAFFWTLSAFFDIICWRTWQAILFKTDLSVTRSVVMFKNAKEKLLKSSQKLLLLDRYFCNSILVHSKNFVDLYSCRDTLKNSLLFGFLASTVFHMMGMWQKSKLKQFNNKIIHSDNTCLIACVCNNWKKKKTRMLHLSFLFNYSKVLHPRWTDDICILFTDTKQYVCGHQWQF